jgi:hypothetical protein
MRLLPGRGFREVVARELQGIETLRAHQHEVIAALCDDVEKRALTTMLLENDALINIDAEVLAVGRLCRITSEPLTLIMVRTLLSHSEHVLAIGASRSGFYAFFPRLLSVL